MKKNKIVLSSLLTASTLLTIPVMSSSCGKKDDFETKIYKEFSNLFNQTKANYKKQLKHTMNLKINSIKNF
ncbi:Uncharacterised protein [Mycoplasmopsis caviae]|uniref:Lipoprotein n=1 Tax=Mycoplasmopsis caviae TaxID=55603 RepID=A0A3P8L7J3_9BACT|nr:Uncharacterised protein [Mycoplasmopsis caviae]